MAVTNAQVNELRRRQDTLRREIADANARIEEERERIAAENRERLELLLNESAENLERRDSQIRGEYMKLLDEGISQHEQELERGLRGLREQYRQVCDEVNAALAEERQKTEAVMIKQQKFEEAYKLRKEFARETAKNTLEQARAYFEQLSAEPLSWFMRGHLELYRTQLGEILRLIDGELYESAAAVGDNMLLSMRMDMTDTGELFCRWFRYYGIFCSVLETERRLLFERFLKLPERLEGFRAAYSGRIDGGKISGEFANNWLDGGYEKLKEIYSRELDILRPFRGKNGKPVSDEKEVKAVMLENPDLSVNFSEAMMYRGASGAVRHVEDAEKELFSMLGRMEAFEERLALANETIDALAQEAGYTLLDLPPLGNEGEKGAFTMTFADSNNVHTVDVILVPVRRYSDGAWTNHAVWFCSEGTSERTADIIGHCLADVFVKERKIPLSGARMSVNQTRDERIRKACSEMQLMRNMRLN